MQNPMKDLFSSLKLTLATLLACCVAYPLAVLAVARTFAPASAEGSLLRNASGQIVGSRLIAQKFTQPRYFWPRPSAVDYNGAGAGGSNLSPASPKIRQRAEEVIAAHGAGPGRLLPADLATASGSGLDPHITEQAALFQAGRVAAARGLAVEQVEAKIRGMAFSPGGAFAPERLVNVLELNLVLDGMK
jgi:K+-transporting ATPase ATPase C chain